MAHEKRTFTYVNAHLILRQKDQVLLLERQNTGFRDGQYGLVAGHVEEGESAKEGLAREAKEEAGIIVHPDDLHFVHCIHSSTNRFNIDLFFECHTWKGEVCNQEPNKCSDLRFFSLRDLPPTIIPYVARVLEASKEKIPYSEYGWQSICL